ncbi:MAG: hypothetical protein AAGK10_12395, partial [Cyanobacteria bacterium J06555_3]
PHNKGFALEPLLEAMVQRTVLRRKGMREIGGWGKVPPIQILSLKITSIGQKKMPSLLSNSH